LAIPFRLLAAACFLCLLPALSVIAGETPLRLPNQISTFADGRKPIESLYQSYLRLQDSGWTLEIIANSKPAGTTQALPIIALCSPARGPAVWILAGVHGEEPAGPNAIAAAIDDIAELGRNRPVVLLPLLNPQGYARNWRYLNVATYSENIDGQSVGDSSHLLPSTENPEIPRASSPSSPEAGAITAFVLRLRADYPPLYSIDLHEDNLIDQGYVYSQGAEGASDPLAIEAVAVLRENGVPLKMSGETRFGEPVAGGIIGPIIDGSIDEFMTSSEVLVEGHRQPGPAARTVLVFETPAAALPLERRIDAHAALIRRLADRIAASAGTASPPRYGIRLEEAWIPMPDGPRLSVDLYRPDGATAGRKFPVLLEYLPYRKHEGRVRNYPLYSYFVERGYVVAAVDIRGTGNSEGRLIPHQYSEIEQDDGELVIDWLAQQSWSNGMVGMFGISWGGFNSIQMALRNPPALKAIIAVDATEDLYQDDVHYMDGIMHVDSWEMSQDLDNARPGAPDYRIDEAYFRDRFDTEPWMLTYRSRQRDGPFWDRASGRDRYQDIRIPSFHIGGWYDGYRDSIPRMLANVKAPVKAMIGAWSHAWPHEPYPEPGMEWRHEAVRWFDHWLKGIDTGILEEPRFAVYVRNWHPPGPYLEYAPGSWRYEDGWPIARIRDEVLYPQDDRTLARGKPPAATHLLRYFPAVGIEGGGPVMWWGDVAHDQRPTDAFSLIYDSAALTADTEILGLPRATLEVSADAPRANWIARLSDVAPDGTVTQVAGAAFNGSHRLSAREPSAIVPGERFTIDIEMHFTSWVFPRGHRMRLAVNNAQWPMLWPTPDPMTTSLHLGAGSRLSLPVVPFEQRPVPAFLPPRQDPALPGYESLDTGTSSGYGEISAVERNPQTGAATAIATNSGASRFPWGTERYHETIRHSVKDREPANASVLGSHRMEVELPDRRLSWEASLSFRSDHENFYYSYQRRLSENGKLLREKIWTRTIPRDFQ